MTYCGSLVAFSTVHVTDHGCLCTDGQLRWWERREHLSRGFDSLWCQINNAQKVDDEEQGNGKDACQKNLQNTDNLITTSSDTRCSNLFGHPHCDTHTHICDICICLESAMRPATAMRVHEQLLR